MGKGKESPRRRLKHSRWSGISQLTLVEHSLCPLEPPEGGYRHEPEYFYFKDGKKRTATAVVECPLGLNPKDERSLWRLVALVFCCRGAAAETLRRRSVLA